MASPTGIERMGQAVFDGTAWSRSRIMALTDHVAGDPTGEAITVTAPAVAEPIGEIPAVSPSAVSAAIERARDAQPAWAAQSPAERSAVLDRFADLVEEHKEALLDLIQLETGKARKHAAEELLDPITNADYYAEELPSLVASVRRRPAFPLVTSAHVEYDPVGVVGIISPWNYPLGLSFVDAIPALAAGNAIVLKPDEKTPFTALRLAELLFEAGLPEAVCQVVTGDGPVVGDAVIQDVDYVTFTGSSETGRIVAAKAGEHLVDCSMELGGKNPMLVLEDADIDMTARGATQACFTNAGQLCIGMERIYVAASIFDDFLDAFIRETQSLTLGADFGYDADVGSLINQDQLDRVHEHVEDARDKGATVECGGRKRTDVGPYFYEPTILTDVPGDSLAACEETFGPVVRVEPVSSTEEAINRANDTSYGLNASVWTSDTERGQAVASEINSGTVCINDGFVVGYVTMDAPMGGVGDSGIGRRHGPEGLKRYLEPKTVATSRIGPLGAMPYVPDSLYARSTLFMTDKLRRIRRFLR